MRNKFWILLLVLIIGSSSCVTYVTDKTFNTGSTPIVIEHNIIKVFDNTVNGVTIWRLDTPFIVKYSDRKAIETISGIFAVKRVQGLPYSMYFSTYKLTDVCEIELMISHYIHHKAFKNLESWTIKQSLVKQ